jgi:predicted dehydrogenase
MWNSGSAIAPDTCQCWAELQDGATFSLMVSNAAPELHIHRWEIVGEAGAIVIENKSKDYMSKFTLSIVERQGSHLIDIDRVEGNVDGRVYAFTALASRFISAVKTNTQTYPSFTDGLRVQSEIEAALRSNACRHIAPVPRVEGGQ